MHDLPDIVRDDEQNAPKPELDAAQVRHKHRQIDDHGCVDSYVQPMRRDCEW